MPNQLTAIGLETASYSELYDTLSTGFQTIFGNVNLGSTTPDGQLVNIFIQMLQDAQDLMQSVNSSFDPDQAFGVILDQRVALNGIQRLAGTYTTTNITIVTSQALNLYGLDQTTQPVYTVSDNSGNQWQLITSQTVSGAGTYVYLFQAATTGAVSTTPNTITTPVTVVLGVVSVNNPTTYATLGINEETDAQLKLRRQQSIALSSQGFAAGLQAALKNINGVTDAFVYENYTGATNGDGVPAHSIWVIVSGGTASDIANAIYSKRNAGCGMFGAQSFQITQADGSPFLIYWDDVVPQDLYIKFDASSLDGVNVPNTSLILSQLPIIFTPGVNEKVNINDLATLVQSIDPNTLVTNAGFSTSSGGTYTNTLLPSAKNKQFVVSSANISITVV
jgi:hypothetical protein